MKVSSYLKQRFDHQLLRRLVAFMYEQPSTLIDYFAKDAIIVADEYNRIKETEKDANN